VARRYSSLILVLGLVAVTVCAMAAPPGPGKLPHVPSGFRNPQADERPDFVDFLRWRWERLWKDIPGRETYHFPLAENDPPFLRENQTSTTLTWIGHATVLLQVSGLNILTDPIYSERASPVQWAGPRRVVRPGLAMEDLPPVHAVLISHDHYDALDRQTVHRLHDRRGGDRTTFFVPLGMKAWFQNESIQNVVEVGWWEEHQLGQFKFIAVPVQHWSKRGLFSKDDTLWAGWVVVGPHFRFFFVGDSGYSDQFKEIGEKFGPFDLTAIPIGAYEPRWFMKHSHMDPEEAVQVHLDVASRKSVGIHWGTFILTDEPLDEPPVRLRKALMDRGVSSSEFLVLKHGETIVLDGD
jgi:N-acyl-phosphatidylethanolamine-hydrolysing phospholipase D